MGFRPERLRRRLPAGLIGYATLVVLAALVACSCAPVIDNLPKDVPKGYVECSWRGNPGFPLTVWLLREGQLADGAPRLPQSSEAVYRSSNKRGRVRFAARPGTHVLLVSAIGDAEVISPFARGGGAFGPLPANERETIRVQVRADMTTPVEVDFERQDTWADWEGQMSFSGSYLMKLACRGPAAE